MRQECSCATLDTARFHDNRAHGDDSIAIKEIDGYVCAVVADGISMSGYGAVASSYATDAVIRTFCSVYGDREASIARNFAYFVESACYELQAKPQDAPGSGAETTLSIVVADPRETMIAERKSVKCNYFALGDSPIIVCREQQSSTRSRNLAFLAHQVHNRPIVVEEEGILYSYLDVSNGTIRGVPAIGGFQLFEGDICLVMTDGVPYDPHIIYDFGEKNSFRFLNTVTTKGASAGAKWLKRFVAQEALADDGSLAILRYVAPSEHAPDRAGHVSESVSRSVGSDGQLHKRTDEAAVIST